MKLKLISVIQNSNNKIIRRVDLIISTFNTVNLILNDSVHLSNQTIHIQQFKYSILPRAKHFRTLCRAEALINSLCGGDGRVIDPPVEKQHDQHRYIERTKSAANKFLI